MHVCFLKTVTAGGALCAPAARVAGARAMRAIVYRYVCFGYGLVLFYVALGAQMSMLRGEGTGARKTVLAAAAAALPVVAVELEEPPTP